MAATRTKSEAGTLGGKRRTAAVDQETRDRLAAWLRHEIKRRAISGESPSQRQIAEKLGLSHAYLSRILTGVQTAGLEVLIRLHRVFHVDANVLLDDDPPSDFFRPGSER